jgi:uncharacterized protein YutE (UPF0331/DUF86 family)
MRLSEALEQLDQANTIFNYVFLVLSGFEGFGDWKWDHRLEALVTASNLLGPVPDRDYEESRIIANASREIALRRLPCLLCIALVSAAETALEDLAVIQLRQAQPNMEEDAVQRKAHRLMGGGPSKYLANLADALKLPFLQHEAWEDFHELVATRNVLVHRAHSVADASYVGQAGEKARVKEGETLEVDNAYLTRIYAFMKVLMIDLLQVVLGRPPIHHK